MHLFGVLAAEDALGLQLGDHFLIHVDAALQLVEPPALRRLGLALTWGGLLLEAGLAWSFLAGWPDAVFRGRHVLLMAFAVVTYAVAPVAGFGWLLAAMGCAQCAANQIVLRAGYALVFVVVFVYAETPLVPLMLEAIAG